MFSAELPSIRSFVRVNHKVNGPGRVATCDFCLLSFRQRRTGICCFGNDNRKAWLNPQISSNSFNKHSPPRGCSHSNSVRDKVLSTAVPTIQQSVARGTLKATGVISADFGVWTLFSNTLLSYLKHFFPGISTQLVTSPAHLCLAMAQSPLAG